MALHDITLTYVGLSVAFRNWKSADLPRSRRTFVTESSYATSGNLIKSGTSFELPYLWTIAADLYQTEYDKVQMIWEYLDYSRRNQRTQIAIDVNVASNVFSSTAHPYQNGDVVTLSTTGTLPSPLVSTRDYWIIDRATNSFKLATPRELNGGVYYYARFLADWVAPPEFGKAYSSVKLSPNNSVVADQVKVRAVALVLQDTGVKI